MTRITLALLAGVATVGFMSTVQAADLIIDEPEAPGYVAASGDWDGVFVGVFGGYAAGTLSGPTDIDVDGWLLGVNAGVNFTLTDSIVAGIVGDLAWSDVSGAGPEFNWFGSARGRVGFDGGAFLPYLTAGLAFAHEDFYDVTSVGWTVGAGVEFAVTDDVSVDLLYRYSDFGEANYGGSDATLTTQQATIGLNWAF